MPHAASPPPTSRCPPRPRGSLALALALIAGLAATPRAAAAPCCMSATAFGIGRLLIWEDFALGLRTTLGSGLGAWDADGRWRPYDAYGETEWRSEIWGLVGIDRRWSLFARVPGVVLARSTGADDAIGGGLGDVSAGVRYEILAIGEYAELPAIALTVAALAPTGVAADEATTPLAVDVTGRGAWVLSTALSIELTRLPWFVRLDLGASVPLPARRADLDRDQRLGPSLDVAPSGGIEVVHDVVLSIVPRFTWTDVTRLDGTAIAGSSRFDMGIGVAGSWRIDPHWTLQAALDVPIPADGLGKNQPGRVATTLGLRYGSF